MRSAPVLDREETPVFEVPVDATRPPAGLARRAGAFFLHEFREMLPPTIFFFVGFNLIVLTTNLILDDYSVAFASFMLAAAAALVVGKSVLVANAMAVLRRYDRAPLIQPILFKTVFYWAIVFIARLLEHFIRFWLIEHNQVSDFLPHMIATLLLASLRRDPDLDIGPVPDLCDGVRAQPPVRRWRAAAPPLHPPAVRAAAEPEATDPRAGSPEQPCRCALGR